ncbi:MAG: DNA gyrase subunit B, partial [Pseudomonadales bacterium]|nr:DNA gyrase subunit B [Pseudomonadales bacterium]
YPELITREMLYLPHLTEDALSSEAQVRSWTDALAVRVENVAAGGARYDFSVELDPEHNVYLPVVRVLEHGVATNLRFPQDFFLSSEYRAICALGERLDGLLEEGAYAKRGEKTYTVNDFEAALAWLMKESRRGQDIQRYKGLGEMNPDQLWETTMDPEIRRMLRVTIEDAIGADRVFTTLMGDEVEPRREFIETNALSVANLDV